MLNAPCLEGVGTYRRGKGHWSQGVFLLDSFDTHAAKSPKKRLVSQSKEQEAKLEGEDKHDEKKRRHYGRSLVRPVRTGGKCGEVKAQYCR